MKRFPRHRDPLSFFDRPGEGKLEEERKIAASVACALAGHGGLMQSFDTDQERT
jgi:hypothetical protein